MLNFKEISKFYPQDQMWSRYHMIREYLQFKILEIIFGSVQGSKLSFIGGTALRIIYQSGRFSEDLDFDNFDLSEEDFRELSEEIKKDLEREGYKVSVEAKVGEAFRCRVKFSDPLYQEGLSPHQDEKVLIQVDTTPHKFSYRPDNKILNKFDVFTQIRVTPSDILLSQKIYAAFNRARMMGRDFYDMVFLLSVTRPNYGYLKQKIDVGNAKELRDYLINKSCQLDFNRLAEDVKPFLIRAGDKKRVELFFDYIKQASF